MAVASSLASEQTKDECIELAARLGYATRAFLYAVLGTLALLFAFGKGGKLTDNKGALDRISAQPFGDVLLWMAAVGLACYAVWCGVRVFRDDTRERKRSKRIVRRIGHLLGVGWYSTLSVYAGQLAYGASHSKGGGTKTLVAKALAVPFGQLAIVIVGIITLIFGLHQIWKAFQDKAGSELQGASMSPSKRRMALRVARVGIGGRGVVFPVIGGSLVLAALRRDPGEAEGFGDALGELASKPYGEFLIAFVALGLLAYALYQLCVARYGRIPAH